MIYFILITTFSFASSNYEINRLKGIIELQKGNYNAAEKIFTSLENKDDTMLLLGITYNKKGEHQKALSLLKNFSSKNTSNKVYHFYLAESLFKTQNIEEALEEFRKSELLNERVEESSLYSGYIYLNKQEYEKAFGFFVKVIDQNGPFKDLAHFYAGVCLYNQAYDDYTILKDAQYHFEKINYFNTNVFEEAKKYITVINEYINGGVTRYKRRWDLSAKTNISYTNKRAISPISEAPNLNIVENKKTVQGYLEFDSTFAPILKKKYSLYLLYDFKTDLGFDSDVSNTNYQYHNIGLGGTYQSDVRNWELNLKYYYNLNSLYKNDFKKLMSAHVIELSYETSIQENISIKASMPIQIIDGNNSVIDNSFSGHSYAIYLSTYAYLKNGLNLKITPFISFFNLDYDEYSSTSYGASIQTKLPLEILFFKPRFGVTPIFISNSLNSRTAIKYELEFFSPFGIGMSGVAFIRSENNYINNISNFTLGLGFEYTY